MPFAVLFETVPSVVVVGVVAFEELFVDIETDVCEVFAEVGVCDFVGLVCEVFAEVGVCDFVGLIFSIASSISSTTASNPSEVIGILFLIAISI